MSEANRHAEFCYNCGIRLSGAFCSNCGQREQELNPSLRHFFHDLSHELLHFDGRIVRSVSTLLFRPGMLTKDHFEGRRARWVSPIRLYLVFSIAFFTFTSMYEEAEESMQTTSRLMVVLLPMFAWIVSRLAPGSMNFPQHLYFALHVHAAWFAAWLIREGGGEILSPRFMNSTRWLGHLMLLYVLVYAVWAFRTAYGEKLWSAALRMSAVLAAYLIVLIGVMVGFAALQSRVPH